MNFKKPKEQIASDAANRAYNKIQTNLAQMHNNSMSMMGYTVSQAISDGIREAILSMVEDTYTDQEFEQDIGLRDKQ
jgi:uncharacterized protein YjgD (DUF1641 family)